MTDLKALQERHTKEDKDKDPKDKQKEVDTLLADSTPCYISVPQLSFILMELQLQMTSKEVEILASGNESCFCLFYCNAFFLNQDLEVMVKEVLTVKS